jgi:hypothetical protein
MVVNLHRNARAWCDAVNRTGHCCSVGHGTDLLHGCWSAKEISAQPVQGSLQPCREKGIDQDAEQMLQDADDMDGARAAHMLVSVTKEALDIMAGLFGDLGEGPRPS